MRVLLVSMALLLAACGGGRQPTVDARPKAIETPPQAIDAIDAFEHLKQLGRGVNFGNALEAPREGEWGMTLEERYFDLVKEGGFDTIRLPVRWSAHAQAGAPYAIDAAFFERVDWAIEQATKRGLNIVVNMHHYDELMTAPEAQRERFTALWRQIAARYRDRPSSVLFELCNEPNGMASGAWAKLFGAALAAVRATNPTRTVIIGGVDWNSVKGLLELELPEDDRHLIATFHYYLPFQFTHQGAEWVNDSAGWLGTEWKGSGSDKAYVTFDLDKVAEWSREKKRPVWLGEFGAYSKADLQARARWTAWVARSAEKRGMAWAYWEFGAGFGVYDRARGEWVNELRQALVGSR